MLNAVIQQRYQALSWAEVQAKRRAVHDRFLSKISAFSDADLQRPYRHFQPAAANDHPIIIWLSGGSYKHYDEHLPWMQAIAGSEK